MESFDRYLQQGVKIGLGTDTYPLDIIAEMRYASRIARVVDGTHTAGRTEDLFNAATVWGADALGRPDLGRLAEDSAADVVIIDLQDISYGPMRDPVTALVDFGTGKDVETVIVAGEVVIENGTSTRVDEANIVARAQAAATAGWDGWAERDWANRDVETITPPAFPTRSAAK
jgi:cytosine/adenosine deaminase-related metal-dependent hydrolase